MMLGTHRRKESPMPHDSDQLRDFARRYTEAWCSQQPTRVAAHYVADGRIAVSGAAPAPILEVAARSWPLSRTW
jgi:hypothetical protein